MFRHLTELATEKSDWSMQFWLCFLLCFNEVCLRTSKSVQICSFLRVSVFLYFRDRHLVVYGNYTTKIRSYGNLSLYAICIPFTGQSVLNWNPWLLLQYLHWIVTLYNMRDRKCGFESKLNWAFDSWYSCQVLTELKRLKSLLCLCAEFLKWIGSSLSAVEQQ